MTISSAVAGQQPSIVTNDSTTYNLTTLNSVRVITGKLNTNMPAGTILKVQLAAPVGATSSGSVSMSTTASNLVTAIPKVTVAINLSITYTFSATVSAAQVTNAAKTLTLTLQ